MKKLSEYSLILMIVLQGKSVMNAVNFFSGKISRKKTGFPPSRLLIQDDDNDWLRRAKRPLNQPIKQFIFP